MSQDMAYHFGVFMGDGFIERYKADSNCWYVGLKAIDKDFVEHWQEVLARLTDKKYAIREEKPAGENHNIRYRCRCGKGDFARLTIAETDKKTKIPQLIWDGDTDIKKMFIQGLMDSEGWVSFTLKSLGSSHLSLSFGVSDEWCYDVNKIFSALGIKTSKVWIRKATYTGAKPSKKPRKDFYSFEIDIVDYVTSGLGFNIKRKQDRLDYCSRILTDYTHGYPRYGNYLTNNAGRRYSRPPLETCGEQAH